MKKIASIILASVALFATSAKAEYKFNFVMHSDTNNAFWAAVHKGFKMLVHKLMLIAKC